MGFSEMRRSSRPGCRAARPPLRISRYFFFGDFLVGFAEPFLVVPIRATSFPFRDRMSCIRHPISSIRVFSQSFDSSKSVRDS
jgi:hypothetical protein